MREYAPDCLARIIPESEQSASAPVESQSTGSVCDHDELKRQLELRDAELERGISETKLHSVRWSISLQRDAIRCLLVQLTPNDRSEARGQ